MSQTLKLGSKNLNVENWKVYHPSGKHMFTCGEKKAMWYINKNLAEILLNESYAIKLKFHPKGYGYSDEDRFGLSGRDVKCVVSGLENNLQRHHVVPYCYRKYFPEEYKSKNHHDVVLINEYIHQEYEKHALLFKREMSLIYNIPSIDEFNLQYSKKIDEISANDRKVVSKLHSLFKNYGRIPQNTIKENLLYIADYLNIERTLILNLNYIQLYKLYLEFRNITSNKIDDFKKNNKHIYDHGFYLVKKLNSHSKIESFVKMWRKHFIDTMKPKYMPEGWHINFKVKVEL